MFLFKVDSGKKLGVQFFVSTEHSKLAGKNIHFFAQINADSVCSERPPMPNSILCHACLVLTSCQPWLQQQELRSLLNTSNSKQALDRSGVRGSPVAPVCASQRCCRRCCFASPKEQLIEVSVEKRFLFELTPAFFCFQHSRKLLKRPLFRSYFSSVSEWF